MNLGLGGKSLSVDGGGGAAGVEVGGATGGNAALEGLGLGARICASRACSSCFGSETTLRRLIL